MEEIQGAAACSFILPPLLQDLRSSVQLTFPECNASRKRDLALDKTRSTTRVIIRQIFNVKPEDVATIKQAVGSL